MESFTSDTQQGFSMIEAMVAILLVSILGLGMVYATSTLLTTQRFSTTQSIAIIQLREYLQTGYTFAANNGEAGSEKVTIAGQTVQINDSPQPSFVAISIGSIEKEVKLPIRARSLTIESKELFSGDHKITLSY